MTAVQFPLGAQFEKVKREVFFFAVLLAPRVGLSITLFYVLYNQETES